jgi:hypothetical protein
MITLSFLPGAETPGNLVLDEPSRGLEEVTGPSVRAPAKSHDMFYNLVLLNNNVSYIRESKRILTCALGQNSHIIKTNITYSNPDFERGL